MPFDWGSFLGGGIGAIGAFAAAYLAFALQSRIGKRKAEIEVRYKVANHLQKSVLDLVKKQNTNVLLVWNCIIDITDYIEGLLPLATEAGNRVYKDIRKSMKKVTDSVYEVVTKEEIKDLDWISSEDSRDKANALIDLVGEMLLEEGAKLRRPLKWY